MSGFPDVETAIRELLEPIATTYTAIPDINDPDNNDSDTLIPMIEVNRVDGGENGQGWQDTARVRVRVLADTRPQAAVLNDAVRAALRNRRAVETTVGVLDKIRNDTTPTELPYGQNDTDRMLESNWIVVSRLQ